MASGALRINTTNSVAADMSGMRAAPYLQPMLTTRRTPVIVLLVIWAISAAIFVLRYIREVKDIYLWALEVRVAIFFS